MALVVGINVAVCLHLLISAPSSLSTTITRFYPLHWWGVVAIVVSGLALLAAYPAKALTNPVFYLKLAALVGALTIARVFETRLSGLLNGDLTRRRVKRLAITALCLWLIVLFAGRFLAYTHSILLASRYF